MIRYLLGLIIVAVSVYGLIYFYPGQTTGEDAATDAELPAPQTSPAPTQPVPTPPEATDVELPAPPTPPAPAQPVPTPPEATDVELPAPSTPPASAQPAPMPPAATDSELPAPQTSAEPTQPVPMPPAATDGELPAPQPSAEPTQSVPTPPAAASPAPEREPGASTTLAKPSPQNLSKMTARVQEALMRQGYYKGGVDGVSGPQTRAAIIEYQKAQGLPQTGRMDIQTLTRLGISIP